MDQKRIKSLLGIMLSLVMMIMIALPAMPTAFADNGIMPIGYGGTGSITLNAPEKDGKHVNLDNMTVKAYHVLEAEDDAAYKSKLFVVTEDFKAFFQTAQDAFYTDSTWVSEGTLTSKNMYLTFKDNHLQLSESKPDNGTYITIANTDLSPILAADKTANNKYFAASLMEAVLTKNSVDGTANAENAKILAEWLREYAKSKPIEKSTDSAGAHETGYLEQTFSGGATSIEFNELDFGYWLLVSENEPANVANVDAIFKIATDEPNADGKMKLEEQIFDKQVKNSGHSEEFKDETTAGAKDVLNYKITTKIPDLTDYDGSHLSAPESKENYEYKFTDTLQNQWLVDSSNKQVSGAEPGASQFTKEVFAVKIEYNGTTVTLKDKTVEGFELTTWVAPADLPLSYFLKESSTYGEYKEAEGNSQQFILDFDIEKLRELEKKAFGPDGWKEANVTVEYNAELTSDAVWKNDNEVRLDYSNDPNTTTPQHLEDHTTVYTYGFKLTKKFEKGDVSSLYDKVTFSLFKTNGPTEEAVGDALEMIGADGVYQKADSVDAETPEPAPVKELKLNSDGTLEVSGLDEGYYILKETAAPDGYAKINKIVIYINANGETHLLSAGSSSVTEGDAKIQPGFDEDDTHKLLTFEVTNYKGASLPETGGKGMRALLIGGVAMLTLAGALVILKRKRRTE